MKRGDLYQDLEGNEYEYFTIAVPTQDDMIHTLHLQKFAVAKEQDNSIEFDLYTCSDGVTFIDTNIPYVIYQRKEDYNTENVLAMKVNEFFSYIHATDDYITDRFSLKR